MHLADPEPLHLQPPLDPLTEGLTYLNAPEPDYEQAVYWLRVAADADVPEGLAMLAFCQLEGLGLPRDPEQARDKLERASAAGSLSAKFHLGRVLVAGWGGVADAPRGVALYTVAAAQGHADATFNLAACLDAGWGCQADRLAAKALFLRARALGCPLKSPGLRVRERELDAVRKLAHRFEIGDELGLVIEERQREITLKHDLVRQLPPPVARSGPRRWLLKALSLGAVVTGVATLLASLFGSRGHRSLLAHDAGPTSIA